MISPLAAVQADFIISMGNIGKTINFIKRNGLIKGYYAVKERLEENKKDPYIFVPVSDTKREEEILKSKDMDVSFSILVPSYETKREYLLDLINSVLGQTYPDWELIIADASKSDCVQKVVGEFSDSRIKYVRLQNNDGISGNSNEGLKHCTKEYIALLDHDDILTCDALFEFAQYIINKKAEGLEVKVVYSDEDKTNSDNSQYFEPNIKPSFNLDLLMSNNYICHFLCMESELLKSLGFRKEYDGAQDHDLLLRAVSSLKKTYGQEYEKVIGNISKVLYHWRCHEMSTAANPKSKEYAYLAGKRAVEDYLLRENIKGTVHELPHVGFFYVEYETDIFAQRKEVGAIGLRIIDNHNTVVDGIYDEDKEIMFKGLNKHFSGGYLHRAACQMEIPYVNVKSMIPSDEAVKVLSKLLNEEPDLSKDIKALSIKFSEIMRMNGFKFVYDPKVIVRSKDV